MFRWTLVFALASLVLSTFAPLASAQDEAARERAREHFALGVERYEAEDYAAALEAFQEAYRLAPHPMVRVNMANCYERLSRPIEALHHFERFLSEAEGASRQQRREVQATMNRLRRQVGEVRLSIAPDGALVTIDSTETRRAPILEPVRLSAGTHHVRVRMDGYRTVDREVEVIGGESQRVVIALERGQDEPEPVAAASDLDEASDSEADALALADAPAPDEGGGFIFTLTPASIIAGSTAVALAAAALVTGPLAIVANDDFEDAVLRSNVPGATPAARAQAREDGLSAADRANTLSVLTDVFTIGAIAAAGVTAFFVIVDGFDAGAEAAPSEGVELALTPSVGADGGGLMLSGRF